MKPPIFAANWKMNLAPADALAFARQFVAQFPRHHDRTVLFFPPALTLHVLTTALKDRPDIFLGVQNIHWEDQGAFTGENSAAIARAAGARYVLAGHSERRHLFGETDEECGRKVAAATRAGLTPVICVGETLDQRDRGETNDVLLRQLRAAVATIDARHVASSVIAYEPVWAIGTGRTAAPADAATAHAALRGELRSLTGDRAAAVPILYGGSVNRGNAPALLATEGIDGVLVGGASLDPEGWAAIART